MGRSRKKGSVSADDRALDELVDRVIDDLRESYHSDLEPFNLYAQRVRLRVHADMVRFRERFNHGYKVLLDELEREMRHGGPS